MTRFCTNCGAPIPDNGGFCTNCGAPAPYGQPNYTQQAPPPPPQPQYQQPQYQQPYQQPYAGERPKNYMVWSVLATIFCCIPLGAVAIINSAKVNKLWDAGKYDEAKSAASKAKTWIIISAIIAIIGGVYSYYTGAYNEILQNYIR